MEIHPCVSKIENELTLRGLSYERFDHEPVRTSEEAAVVRDGYSLQQGAKALIVRIKDSEGKHFAMLVVPGDRRFNSKLTRSALGAKDILSTLEPDCIVDSPEEIVQFMRTQQ
jgi:prolyl-tRNA editing enzyme YbaK/EbsC (Cys-tRNA(Pro) deacylase)